MKNLTYIYVFALATILAGCSDNTIMENETYKEKTIDFSVTVDTRSIGNYEDAEMEMFYAIYDSSTGLRVESGMKSRSYSFGMVRMENKHTGQLKVLLQENKEYDFIFWMQQKGENGYDISELKSIKVDYSNINRKEAYCSVIENFSPSKKDTLSLSLRSPFAKLNILTEKEDTDDARKAGVDIDECRCGFIIDEVADTYYPLSGTASSTKKKRVEIPSSAVPNVTFTENGKDYRLLGTSVFLAEDRELTNFTSVISGEDIEPIEMEFDNVPVRKSFSTNIIGRFLTTEVRFNVTIEPNFNGEHTEYVDN